MHADFNSVEAELQEIETDFATGRMNAFGSLQVQDTFLRELKRIAEVETQVFYKTCSILKSGNKADHAMLVDVFGSAQPPPQSRGRSGNHGSNTGGSRTPSPGRGGGGVASNSSNINGGAGTTYRSGSVGASSTDLAGGGGGGGVPGTFPPQQPFFYGRGVGPTESVADGPAPHIRSSEWGNETGFGDSAFEDVSERFRHLEADFSVLGDQLRQISRHVTRLNDMSAAVNRGGGVGVGATPSSSAPPTTTNAGGSVRGGAPPGSGRYPGGGDGSRDASPSGSVYRNSLHRDDAEVGSSRSGGEPSSAFGQSSRW